MSDERSKPEIPDTDPQETAEWLDSLEYVVESKGPDRAKYLFERLRDRLGAHGAQTSAPLNEPGDFGDIARVHVMRRSMSGDGLITRIRDEHHVHILQSL